MYIDVENLKTAIANIEDECYTYADELQSKVETYSYGEGVLKGMALALKHIRPIISRATMATKLVSHNKYYYKCKNCGKLIDKDMPIKPDYCPNCGKPIELDILDEFIENQSVAKSATSEKIAEAIEDIMEKIEWENVVHGKDASKTKLSMYELQIKALEAYQLKGE